jgi:hypothetical protein
MPRPKRTKITPSVPAPRVRKAAKTVAVVPQPAKGGLNDLYDISDPDQGWTGSRTVNKGKGKEVTPARRRVSGSRAQDRPVTNQDMPMMSGALPGTPYEESSFPEIDLESSSPSLEIGRRDTSTAAENSILAIGNFKRRPRQPSILGRGTSRARSSSVESNLAENNGLMSVGKWNASSVGNFKDHQSKQSDMGRDAAPVRSSSMGLELDRGTPAVASAIRTGNSKRRARETTISGTGRKERLQDTDDELEDEDDFRPDDESTPLNLSKTKSMSSSARSSSSRKRKILAVQVPQSQDVRSSPPLPSAAEFEEQVDPEQEEAVPATGSLVEDEEDAEDVEEEARSSSPELPMPSLEARSVTPEPFSETMAPPQSSSPGPESPPPPVLNSRVRGQRAPSRGRQLLRHKTPLPLNENSPPSSPPSLTHSPNRVNARITPKPKPKKAAPAVSTLSTAELQALLPRRRRHTTRDPFDIGSSEDEIDVSGLASDDDELTHSNIRAAPRRSMIARPTPLRNPAKPKAAQKTKTNAKITYGRNANATSDKENEEHDLNDSLGPLPDDDGTSENSQEMEKRLGKELKNAAKKFAEVDKWELDFEDCTASSSSLGEKDAR